MNLYMMHVGFYDHSIGVPTCLPIEPAINEKSKDAKTKVLALEEFQDRNMHIDGIKEISEVDGYEVRLVQSSEAKDGKVFSYDESSDL